MLKVFVWPYRGKDIAYGHASLQVDGGKPEGAAYISWWPANNRRPKWIHDKLYCAPALQDQTYASDLAGEDEVRPQTIVIDGRSKSKHGLNETAIKAWWGSLRTKGFTDWCTLGPNCSTVVAYALSRGGADQYSDMWSSFNMVWTPNDVATYAKAIAAGIKDSNRAPPTGSSNRLSESLLDGGLPPGGI